MSHKVNWNKLLCKTRILKVMFQTLFLGFKIVQFDKNGKSVVIYLYKIEFILVIANNMY